MSNFSFSRSIFYPVRELTAIFIKFMINFSSLNSFSLDQSKICRLGKGLLAKMMVNCVTMDKLLVYKV